MDTNWTYWTSLPAKRSIEPNANLTAMDAHLPDATYSTDYRGKNTAGQLDDMTST